MYIYVCIWFGLMDTMDGFKEQNRVQAVEPRQNTYSRWILTSTPPNNICQWTLFWKLFFVHPIGGYYI